MIRQKLSIYKDDLSNILNRIDGGIKTISFRCSAARPHTGNDFAERDRITFLV